MYYYKCTIRYLPVLIFLAFTWSSVAQETNYKQQRESMVRQQIQNRGINDPGVLKAMRKVERHRYVPLAYRDRSYGDHPLPIGEGQTISQPYIVGYMTEALELDNTKKVLEIGTGSGYQAAILGELSKEVYTIEIIESLGVKSKALLEPEYPNIKVLVGDGYQGWPEFAPFDAIIVTCSPTHIPEPLQKQLAEGGKMIIPVGETFTQELVLLEKKNGKLRQLDKLPVRFVPMVGESGKKY